MLNVAIAGYGNLGKALEKQLSKRDDCQLTHIFSRRKIDNALRTKFAEADSVHDVDVCLLALGSYEDIFQNLHCFRRFHTVDCFDNHAKIDDYKRLITEVKPDTLSIVCAGWDPGILSVVRGLLAPLGTVATTWGRGQSMGHGNALRTIKGVLDGVQFTCPQEDASRLFSQGERRTTKLVHRLCYVACAVAEQERVREEITQMPDYFADYETEVRFVPLSEVQALKKDLSHRGTVYARGEFHTAEFNLQVTSNADFTAAVMINCALNLPSLVASGYKGAYSPLELPAGCFCDKSCL